LGRGGRGLPRGWKGRRAGLEGAGEEEEEEEGKVVEVVVVVVEVEVEVGVVGVVALWTVRVELWVRVGAMDA
jgi:hypothetical protein